MRDVEVAAMMVGIQADESFILWGPPGQGKSSVIREGLPKLGYEVLVCRVNTMLPHQLHGCPAPDPTGEYTKTLAPEWVSTLNKADKSVFVFGRYFSRSGCQSNGDTRYL